MRTNGASCCITLVFLHEPRPLPRIATLTASPGPFFFFLRVVHLLADLVAEDLVPVDLGAGDGELSAQGFERGVRHGLIVLTDGNL